MALERNNTTTQFEPGCDPEFERVLRRHLKLGGAPVAACVGFDPDTASAFLENALGSAAQAKFESHLAGCAACRRHVIELSRLIGPISAPIPVPVKSDRLESLKQWFDFSSWGWKQQTAGLAAAALLIGAVSSPVWLPGSTTELADSHSAAPASAPGKPAEAALAENQARAEAPVGGAESASIVENNQRILAAPTPQGQMAVADKAQIPTPSVTPKAQDLSLVQDMAREAEFRRRISIELPTIVSSYTPPIAFSQPPGADLAPPSLAAPAPEPPRADAVEMVAQSSQNLVGLQVGPKPDDNPMLDAKGERPRASLPQKNIGRLGGVTALALAPIARSAERDREEKEKPAPQAREREDEGSRSLFRNIRDRRFRFENNVWVDEQYTPTMRWRVKRLILGSSEYEDVLAREPHLKEFFEKAPILVIWRDRIYKVVVPRKD